MPISLRFWAPVLALLVAGPSFAQNFYQKTYDISSESARSVVRSPDGNLLLAGYSDLFPLSEVAYPMLQYLDADGELLWTKTYPLADLAEFTDMIIAADGNLLLTWTATENCGWIKIDPDGNVLWTKALTNFAPQQSGLHRVQALQDGNYLLIGLLSAATGPLKPSLIKIDESGNVLWSNQIDLPGLAEIRDCYEDAGGFLHCVGTHSLDFGQDDGFLAKFGPGGALVGPVRVFSSSSGSEGLTQVVATTQDRLLLAGFSSGFNGGGQDLWLTEVDGVGAIRWSKTYTWAGHNMFPSDLLHLPGEQFLMSINTNGAGQSEVAVLFKIDLSGDLVLLANQYRTTGEEDQLRRLITTPDGLAACGSARRNGDIDTWLIRTDTNGDIPGCCPAPLTVQIKNVAPETDTRVAMEISNLTVQNLPFLGPQDQSAETRTTCFLVDTEFSLSADTVCPGDCVQITLNPATPGADYNISYNGGVPNPSQAGTICYPEAGTFNITRTAQTGACTQSTTHSVLVTPSAGSDKPNAFTPDNDGNNDRFKLLFKCRPETFLMRVYSRWGEIVYESIDPDEGWDGTNYGNPMVSDVYIWSATVDGVESHGEVTLLR